MDIKGEGDFYQTTLTIGGSITVRLVSSFTSLDSTTSLHTVSNIVSFLLKSSLVKLETSRTVTLSPTVSVLCYCHPKTYIPQHSFEVFSAKGI